jgi:hypothetical protein
MYSTSKSHVTSGTDHTDCKKRAWGHRMKCQVSVSVGVKLRRRALVLLPQDGEQQQAGGEATKIIFDLCFPPQAFAGFTVGRFEHACKEPASALCSSGGGRSQVEMRYCCACGRMGPASVGCWGRDGAVSW